MMSIPTGTIIAAVIAFLGALVGSLVAYVGLLISKESKISEFRQAWIDALRVDISDLTGKLVTTYEADQLTTSELYAANLSIATLRTRILLRLNMAETEPDALVTALDKLHAVANSLVPPASLNMQQKEEYITQKRPLLLNSVADTTTVSQKLLKKEWERVKGGEPVYRSTQRWARFVVIALLFAAPVILAICLCWMLIPSAVCTLSR